MKIYTTLGLLIILGVGGFFLWKQQTSSEAEPLVAVKNTLVKSSPLLSPSPIPFEDLTIPYLRNKEYKSGLGELQPYNNNGFYNSYLTSYTSDGLKINGLLTRPTGEKPEGGWPAIVFVHGYIPPTLYRTTEKYEAYIDFLARGGFVVFKIDLRGNGDSEGEPGGAYYSSDYIIDTLNARAALASSDFVNHSKIGIWGHSMAGNVTLRAIAAKPDVPAVSIWGGAGFTYLDLRKYGIQDGSYRPPTDATARQRRRQLLRDTYGEPDQGNPFWKLVAPTDYLKDYKGAIQLNHAVNDDVVNIGYSRDLNAVLDQTSIPHELNEFPGGGHNITNPSFTPAMQKTVEFFEKYLKS
jgi:uncharacterized protein